MFVRTQRKSCIGVDTKTWRIGCSYVESVWQRLNQSTRILTNTVGLGRVRKNKYPPKTDKHFIIYKECKYLKRYITPPQNWVRFDCTSLVIPPTCLNRRGDTFSLWVLFFPYVHDVSSVLHKRMLIPNPYQCESFYLDGWVRVQLVCNPTHYPSETL